MVESGGGGTIFVRLLVRRPVEDRVVLGDASSTRIWVFPVRDTDQRTRRRARTGSPAVAPGRKERTPTHDPRVTGSHAGTIVGQALECASSLSGPKLQDNIKNAGRLLWRNGAEGNQILKGCPFRPLSHPGDCVEPVITHSGLYVGGLGQERLCGIRVPTKVRPSRLGMVYTGVFGHPFWQFGWEIFEGYRRRRRSMSTSLVAEKKQPGSSTGPVSRIRVCQSNVTDVFEPSLAHRKGIYPHLVSPRQLWSSLGGTKVDQDISDNPVSVKEFVGIYALLRTTADPRSWGFSS